MIENCINSGQERIRMATRVRTCNSVKFETGENLLPVLIVVTHTTLGALT